MGLGAGDEAVNMTAALRDLYSTMDKGNNVAPIILLQVLHMAFPRFAERGENGGYQQQDANECWVEVLRMLQVCFCQIKNSGQTSNANIQAKTNSTEGSPKPNAIDQFLGIECSSETKCNEAPEEAPSRTTEKFLQFSCYIDKDVKYLHTGLKNRLSMWKRCGKKR